MFPGFPSCKHSGVEIIQQFASSADRIYCVVLCVATVVVEEGRLQCSFLNLNLPTTTIVAQPFNIIKWQLKFNSVA